MEHTGATLYNDNQMFLSEHPTPDEELRRTELIAHETAHMWFGDLVTMNWFDDVWTKEVLPTTSPPASANLYTRTLIIN